MYLRRRKLRLSLQENNVHLVRNEVRAKAISSVTEARIFSIWVKPVPLLQ